MLGQLLGLVSVAIAVAGGVLAFGFARGFVRRRMRFVDAVRWRWVPLVAAVGGAVVFLPLTLLPLITGGTALAVGLGTGLGTASGVKALKRGE